MFWKLSCDQKLLKIKSFHFLTKMFLLMSLLVFFNKNADSQLIANPITIVESPISKATPRNIYLDLGAFMGDTLQMFKLNGVSTRCHPGVDWEVFALFAF